MLTFAFTGVDGTMTESELLTSGMVGKQIALRFDSSWDALNKTVVFRAGDVTRVVMDPGDPATIPAEVLARPFGKLFVGVYGTDESGNLVIPTIMVEGPMIRYGADPVQDETAKELPVWENLQNQIGNLAQLSTEDKSDLVSAANELSATKTALTEQMEELEQRQAFMGQPDLLETEATATLVDAVNEIHTQVAELAQNCIGFNVDAAQMLVDILSKGLYTMDQTEQIQALAAHFGVEVSEDLSHLILYWDFRTGNLTDRIGGLKATTSADVTMDAKGAHLDTNASYLMFPAGFDGASLAGHTAEIKFGQMSLSQTASTMRLLCVCSGNQPAVTGLQWNVQDCWSKGASLVTEFKDIDMFSGKILLCKCSADGTVLDFYFEDQLIVSVTPTTGFTHLSIGSTTSAAFPLTVEYVRIYPTV